MLEYLHPLPRHLAAGENHVVFLAADGKVYGHGCNLFGQLGPQVPFGTWNPTQPLSFPEAIRQVFAGPYYTVALGVSGLTYTYGDELKPLPVTAVVDIITHPNAIYYLTSCREKYRCDSSGVTLVSELPETPAVAVVLHSDGTVWASGREVWGEFGQGTTLALTYEQPVRIPFPEPVVEIALSSHTTYAVGESGQLYVTGKYWRGNHRMGRRNIFITHPVPFE